MVNQYVGGISAFVLIYFCVKLHKAANKKVLAQIERDRISRENDTDNGIKLS
jgi:hypothetical protein